MVEHPAPKSPTRGVLPAERLARSAGSAAGSVRSIEASWSFGSSERLAFTSSAAAAAGLLDRALATGQRLQEGAQFLAVVARLFFAHDQHELVIVRHAGFVDRDPTRMLVQHFQLDRLVVPEAAERRRDLAREHRRDEVEADVDFVTLAGFTPASPARRAARPTGSRCRRCRPLAGQVRDALDVRPGQRDDRGQRPLHERRRSRQVSGLVARDQQFGLVGDRHVDLAGGQQLQRFGGFRRATCGLTSRPTARKSPSAIAE